VGDDPLLRRLLLLQTAQRLLRARLVPLGVAPRSLPAEFIAAVVSNQGGYYATFAYVSEARRMGLHDPAAGRQRERAGLHGEGARGARGADAAQRLRRETLESAARREGARRPFRSLATLRGRMPLRTSDAELLVKAGALDSIAGGRTRPELLWELLPRRPRGRARARALSSPPAAAPRAPAYDRETVLRHEVETLGFLLSAHPLEPYERAMRGRDVIAARDLDRHAGRRVRILGWHVNSKLVQTKDQEPMEFIAFEDTTAIYDATLFPDAYRRFCHLLTSTRAVSPDRSCGGDFGVCTLTVDKVERL